jgi:hypothetical protein
VHKPEEGKRAAYLSSSTAVQPLDNEAFFALIKEQCKKGSVLEVGARQGSKDVWRCACLWPPTCINVNALGLGATWLDVSPAVV